MMSRHQQQSQFPPHSSDFRSPRTRPRLLLHLITLLALLISTTMSNVTLAVAADTPARCFAETNHCLSGRFRDYWEAHGGLAINGFPLTDPRREILEDGREYLVQYCERVRLEFHPENSPPHDVLLGQFGRAILRDRIALGPERYDAATAPTSAQPGATYFPQTRHNLGARFTAYWQGNGGLAQFGYPITEELSDYGLDLQSLHTVQYFERARFEYHPENAGTPFEVLLGQFGRQILARIEFANGMTGPFAALYRSNPEVAARLGAPNLPNTPPTLYTGPGSLLHFEHGLMIYHRWYDPSTGPGVIQVLCGSPESGEAIVNSHLWFGYADEWHPSLPAGGGPGPRPDTYIPKYGFGLVWPIVRDCLGYATSPEETYYTPTTQLFGNGLLITLPDQAHAYLLYRPSLTTTGQRGRYQQYALPK